MGLLEDFVGAVAKEDSEGAQPSRVPASKEESESFVPLKDLRVGETLRLCRASNFKFPEAGGSVVVYCVDLPATAPIEMGSRIRRYDFSALIKDFDGELLEFPFDSRFFERVSG